MQHRSAYAVAGAPQEKVSVVNDQPLASVPKGSSTEIYRRCNDSQPLRVARVILPTNGASTPPVLMSAQLVLRNRALHDRTEQTLRSYLARCTTHTQSGCIV